jgi:hypothetical protein
MGDNLAHARKSGAFISTLQRGVDDDGEHSGFARFDFSPASANATLMDSDLGVYIIGPEDGPYKIGVAEDAHRRLGQLQHQERKKLLIHAEYQVDSEDNAFNLESTAHAILKKSNVWGEWFDCSLKDAKNAIESVLKG